MATVDASNRKARRAHEARRRTGIAATAAITTAAALTVGVSAPAAAPRVVSNADIMLAADPINLDLITTGGLLGLVNALGYQTIPLSIPNPLDPTAPPFVVNINLNYTNNRPQNVYDTINALTMQKDSYGPLDIFCSDSNNTNGCRIANVVTIGSGAQGLRAAMNSLFSIALGTNLQQYAPLVPGFTAANGIVINNPFRPNGGIDGRFGAALQKLGTAPADAGKNSTAVSNHVFDLTWEYNPQADFPATFNPFSLVNSFMGVLPPITNLLTTKPLDIVEKELAITLGVGGQTIAPGDAEVTGGLAAVAEWFSGSPDSTFDSVFATLVTGTLPMFEPAALGTYLTNSVLKRINSPFVFGDVLSDVLTPAMKILVNIGYPDVVTPAALKANPALAEAGYKAYDRTFAQQQIDFGTVQPLNFEETVQAYGDAWKAFTTSLTEQFKKPLFGIVVPNTIPGQTATTPATGPQNFTPVVPAEGPTFEPAPAAAAAAVSAPLESAAPAESPALQQVSTPSVPKVIAPVIENAPAAEAPAPAPVAQTHRGGSSAKFGAGSDTPGHRGSAHSGADSGN